MKFTLRHPGIWLPLLFCSLPASVLGQSAIQEKVANIVITNIGPKVASESLVRGNIHIKPGDPYIRTSIDQDVINLYATGFFSNIRVSDEHTDSGVVVTYVLVGKNRLTGISFTGNTKFSVSKLSKKISSKVGDPLDERKLFNDCLEIQKLYEKSGYRNTTVKYVTGNFDYDAGRASVTFEVKESPKIRIREVDFEGAAAFKQSKLRHVIKTRKHWWLSWLTQSGVFKEDQFQDDKEKLAEHYRNAGYIDFEIKDIKITNPTPKAMKIVFDVFEGVPYKVGRVTFSGNKLFSTEKIVEGIKRQHGENRSKEKIGTHGLEADDGQIFKPGSLEHDIRAVEDFYGSKGYINVRQGQNLKVVKTPNTETGTMDLEYVINEGDKVFVEKILIKGNVKTKDKVIRRELAVAPGEPFDMVRVRRSKERLEGLTFFENVDTKSSATDIPNHDDLIVGVEEKSTGSFSFGAGFDTIQSISGFVELEQRNFDILKPPYFTGGGQKLRIKVQLGSQFQDYLVSFVEPWFLDRKLILGIDLYHSYINYLTQDNLYNVTRTGGRVSLGRALLGTESLRGSISYNLEQVGVFGVNTNAPTTIVNDSGYELFSRFGASLSYDTRNTYEIANRGQETSIESLLSVGARQYYQLQFKTAWFFRGFEPRHVLELAAKTGVTQKLGNQDVPFYDKFYLGGQDSLRGFDYRSVGPRESYQDGTANTTIGGGSFWFATAEYTIPIIDHLSFAVFYDIGNVSPRPWSVSSQTYQQRVFNSSGNFIGLQNGGNTSTYSDDYGLGLRLDIPHLGPLRLDYGIPIHHDQFSGPSGKFQFGVGFQRPL